MNEQLTIGGTCIQPTMSVKEVSKTLGVSDRTIRRYVEKFFPEIVENGKATNLSELQVTKIKLELQKAKNLDTVDQLPKTDLEKEIIIQQALQLQAEKIERLTREKAEKEKRLEEAQPKIEFFDQVGDSNGNLPLNETAKILGTGRTRLSKRLQNDNIFLEGKPIPYQKYIESGYFEVKTTTAYNHIQKQSFITPKGLQWLQKKYNGVRI